MFRYLPIVLARRGPAVRVYAGKALADVALLDAVLFGGRDGIEEYRVGVEVPLDPHAVDEELSVLLRLSPRVRYQLATPHARVWACEVQALGVLGVDQGQPMATWLALQAARSRLRRAT